MPSLSTPTRLYALGDDGVDNFIESITLIDNFKQLDKRLNRGCNHKYKTLNILDLSAFVGRSFKLMLTALSTSEVIFALN